MLPVAFLAAVALGRAPADAPVAPPADVELVYTGGSGGIGSGRWRFTLLDALRRSARVDAIQAHHGALAGGSTLILATDRRVETLARYLAGVPTCGDPRPGLVVGSRHEILLLEAGSALARIGEGERADARPVDVRRCEADGAAVDVVTIPEAPVPSDLSGFELRLAVDVTATVGGRTETVGLIGRPDDDGARRIGALARLLEQHPGAVFVDGGSFVDGTSSVRDNALSLHRPTTFAALRRLAPTALVPGRTELVAGAARFFTEIDGLPYVATNWTAEDPVLALPRSRRAVVGGVDVAFLGVVDPALGRWPALTADGIAIGEPVAAVQAEVDRLRASGDPPELVVVLTEVDGEPLRAMQRELAHVDLIVGDPGPDTDRVEAIDVTFREAWSPTAPTAWTLPLDGVGYARISVADGALVGLRADPVRITPEQRPDPEVLAAVLAVRLAEYPRHDRPLLPAPDPTAPIGEARWRETVCQAVLERADADVALLPALPPAPSIPGPLTELLVLDALAVLDVLEVVDVLGAALPRMLDKADEIVPIACGAPLGAKAPLIAGRPIEPDRVYQVVTTARVRVDPVLGALLTEGRPSRLLDLPNEWIPEDSRGGPLTLRRAVLEELRALRDAGDADPVGTLTARSPTDLPPRWMLRARPISFGLERFEGADNERFAEIPETLATSPSSLMVAAVADLQLEHSRRSLVWDARIRSAYARLTTDDDETESSDDLKLSTSAALPGLEIPLRGAFRPMPFAEALYDTEFTPVEPEEGHEPVPLQRDLSLTLGLSGAIGVLRTARVGGFALRDLSVPDKPIELGGRTELYVGVPLGRGLSWNSSLDAYVWADTPEADRRDLRFKALVDTRLELPMAWWLRVALYGRLFVFQGRVPATDAVGRSGMIGAALDLAGAFRL